MPVYRYRAYRPDGAGEGGTIEADGIRDASFKLRERGLHPSEISEYESTRRAGLVSRLEKVNMPVFTRQLASLLKAGVPLVESLRALSDESRGNVRSLLINIMERVQSGASLSRAMQESGSAFPDFYTSVVAAGEASGTLDAVLEELSDYLESQERLREKLRAAMIYPAIMATVGVVVLVFIFTFVIPKIVTIFEDTSTALPWATVVLIWVSNFLVHYWWLAAAAAIALAVALRVLRGRHSVFMDRVLLGLPFRSLYFARLTRTLGVLLEGGVPMLRALELSGRATGNTWIKAMVREAGVRVSEGARLSASLSGIPPVLRQLLATGERSGRLTEALRRAAETYEDDFDRRVEKALTLVEPAMILVMGFVVAFIALAVLLPMFQLNQLIR